MEFEWDRRKAETNLKKHAVDFADAVAVFSDNLAITLQDDSLDEERFVSVGIGLHVAGRQNTTDLCPVRYST